MTVRELKELLAHVPDDMVVVLDDNGDSFTTACLEQSQVETVTLCDDDEEEYDRDFFFIRPCTCDVEDMPVIPDENPNLN